MLTNRGGQPAFDRKLHSRVLVLCLGGPSWRPCCFYHWF